MEAHAKIRSSTLAERCESGRIDMLGKHASRQRDRGFESHPLRHPKLARTGCHYDVLGDRINTLRDDRDVGGGKFNELARPGVHYYLMTVTANT